ncbi:zinc-dependent metalloprotease [Coleofasciculus sp. FACHB-712]|uniref:zinc-dependent metalloprotease n=1 Tax=Coleofasciculus sp. FACHB-712 TaxID=2692789 RepID=UPI001F5573C5|nr:zinc-dependent metalloprotease [Coleofasciculus sp. FACHB-712]
MLNKMKKLPFYLLVLQGVLFGIELQVAAQALVPLKAVERLGGRQQMRSLEAAVTKKQLSGSQKSDRFTNKLQQIPLDRGSANKLPQKSEEGSALEIPTSVTSPYSHVWVIKDSQNQPEQQPFAWMVKDTKKQHEDGSTVPLQPILGLLKDTNQAALQMADAGDAGKATKKSGFDEIVKNTEKVEGLFTLYRNKKTGKIYLEIKPEQLNKNFLGTVTMESGIGERGIYSGVPLNDFLFYFRRVNENLHFVVRNVNFRTRSGEPQERSLNRAFSDSVLYSLDIKATHPQRKTLLIDMGDLLLTDLPGLTSMLKTFLDTSYRLDSSKSYFDTAKAFPLNIEISSVYGFSSTSSQDANLATLPDSRALSLKVHYSLSQLPENNGYIPRLADDRIGYFITAYKDFSNDNRREPFVRYIHRWHLEKQDPKASLSPPKKPIVFWIENSVPVEYRDSIREGVLMWNKAFEKAGFKDAIEVRQMPDNATWSPADVRYNTIRWINSLDGYSARGPSRVNPLTGEILDADIIVDANMVQSIKQRYRNLVESSQSSETGLFSQIAGNPNLCNGLERGQATEKGKEENPSLSTPDFSQLLQDHDLCYGMEAATQSAMGAIALSLVHNVLPNSNEMKEFVHQYIRHLISHEIGHTLGLRHNFHGSTLLKPEELNNTDITRIKGMVSSVMDYVPVNLAPEGVKQGEYYPGVVGPYDKWAIEYGYKPSGATNFVAEKRFLEQIASKSPESEYAYATDEDILDLDPGASLWDLSGDVLRYSQSQMDNARMMWGRLDKRYPLQGDSYEEMRVLFNTILSYYFSNANLMSQYIGGQSFSRNHAGDPNGRLPFEPVPLEKQRDALTKIGKYVFAADAFDFPPELLNQLAPSRWRHWGNPIPIFRLDYPIHENLLLQQRRVLRSLLSEDRLNRLRDIELKTKPGEALTLPELFDTLQNSIWTEVQQSDRKPANISSLRRSLQREHLEIMLGMVLRTESVPEDARTLAWYELQQLRKSLDSASKQKNLDTYTKAHLLETRDRINKALNAQLESK